MGRLNNDEGSFHQSFVDAAYRVCGGDDFDVLERTRTPSTLQGMEDVLRESDFYWVVECKR